MRVVAMIALVGVGWLVLAELAHPQRLWAGVLVVAAGVAAWSALGKAPSVAPGLFAADEEWVRSGTPGLTAVELEVAGALDPRLGGDRRLQQRLLAIATHRARVDRLEAAQGRRLLGDDGWEFVTGPKRRIGAEELRDLIGRIEAI